MPTKPHFSLLATSFAGGPRHRNAALILAGLWLAIFFAALFAPPILDDADATHAQAAQHMALTGDLVTLRVDGVRYLEKAPLPYWLAALSFRIFGFNTFAAHLPQALAIALLALLGHRWANQAFGSRTAFYTAIALLTSLGTFLFTRILIPEALLSLLLSAALFAFLKSLGPISSEPQTPVILSEAASQSHRDTAESKNPDALNPTHTARPFPTRSSFGLKVPQGLSLGSLSKGTEPGLQPLENALTSLPGNSVPHSSQPYRDEWVHPPERPAPPVVCPTLRTASSSLGWASGGSPTAPAHLSLAAPRVPHDHQAAGEVIVGFLSPSQPSTPPSYQPPTPPERPALIPPVAPLYPYLMWAFLALAVLTKGLVALVFFLTTTLLYLLLLGEFKQSLPKLKPLTGPLLFLAIAAPWHILAALRNPGWVRFYFWNEHVLRFLGRRIPPDFNRLPGYLYWTLHLVWLFPWSLFLPLGIAAIYRRMRHQTITLTRHIPKDYSWGGAALVVAFMAFIGTVGLAFQKDVLGAFLVELTIFISGMVASRRVRAGLTPSPFHRIDPQQRTILLLSLFAAIVLLFFSLSTNQEYYTFPAYLPILLLTAATITRAEQTYSSSPEARRGIAIAHAAFTAIGAAAALTLLYGLWASRHIPYTPDIGTLLLRRNIAANTLSLSHLFDLTTDAFAALRLPAFLAALGLLVGPPLAWLLRTQRRHIAATTAIAFTSGLFLIAAHLAFARFAPMLSSQSFAAEVQHFEATHPNTQILIFGDQAYGSSLPFYLNRRVGLVDGRTTSLLFGSTYPDAPDIFLTPTQLAATWSQPTLKLLFIPAERREEALRLLPPNPTILREESGKLLLANHPPP